MCAGSRGLYQRAAEFARLNSHGHGRRCHHSRSSRVDVALIGRGEDQHSRMPAWPVCGASNGISWYEALGVNSSAARAASRDLRARSRRAIFPAPRSSVAPPTPDPPASRGGQWRAGRTIESRGEQLYGQADVRRVLHWAASRPRQRPVMVVGNNCFAAARSMQSSRPYRNGGGTLVEAGSLYNSARDDGTKTNTTKIHIDARESARPVATLLH